RGVMKSFGPEDVLRGVNMTLHRGDTLGIIGPSGSGKSVLLKCMVALLPIDCGNLRFDDASIPAMSRDEQTRLRQRVGLLFQAGGLFDSMTVGDNVLYALREQYFRTMTAKEMQNRVAWALDSVGLPSSELGTFPRDLSGGMQKRVGIARTIVTRPE